MRSPSEVQLAIIINADEESSSMDSATSLMSKKTSLTYVIDSRTHLSDRSKLDGMRTGDEELAELLSRESRMTFLTCHADSEHVLLVDEEKASTSFQPPIGACCSNVVTRDDGGAECEALRMSRSCDGGRCNHDTTTAIDGARCNVTAPRSSHGYPLLSNAWKRDDEEGSSSLVAKNIPAEVPVWS